MTDASARATDLVLWARSLALAPGSRVLVVGEGALALARVLSALGLDATAAQASAALPEGAPFVAAAVEHALADVEWDRWWLQRLRARLAPGAALRLRAENLASLATAADAWALLARAGRAGARYLGVARGGDAGARGRRYTRGRLAALCAQGGFAVERIAGTPFGAAWTVDARARAADPVTGLVAMEPAREVVRGYDTAFVVARDRWLAQHRPAPAKPAVPRAFDAHAYAGRTALVLAPHPDDELVGAGGTLLRLVQAGARVVCVLGTDGSAGDALRGAPESVRRHARVEEARAVATRAGFAELVPWGEDEATFGATPALAARLAELLLRERPALVLTPFLTDHHPHHVAMSALLATALAQATGAVDADATVLGYEVWGSAPPDVVCDVTDLRAAVEALLWTYDTGMKVDDFVDLWTRRGVRHARAFLGRPGLAEVFFACAARDYPALLRRDDHA